MNNLATMGASDQYKRLNPIPGYVVTTDKQANMLYLIAVLKSNWQRNKAPNWPIFILNVAKRLTVPSSAGKLGLPRHRDKP